MTQCSATTKAGARCRKAAAADSGLCLTHQGVVKRSTLTREMADSIVGLVREGVLPETAAVALGTPASTFWGWLSEKRTASGDALPLAARIEDAKAAGELVHLRRIIEAGKKDWRASLKVLQILNPDRYAAQGPAPKAPSEVPDGGATDQAGL